MPHCIKLEILPVYTGFSVFFFVSNANDSHFAHFENWKQRYPEYRGSYNASSPKKVWSILYRNIIKVVFCLAAATVAAFSASKAVPLAEPVWAFWQLGFYVIKTLMRYPGILYRWSRQASSMAAENHRFRVPGNLEGFPQYFKLIYFSVRANIEKQGIS